MSKAVLKTRELTKPSVAIVGGGLAGMAAAAALVERGLRVELFESRRTLGGRTASFRDPASGELVDHCQHVSMGCCTNLADFCRRTGVDELFRQDRRLHFIGPDGTQCDFEARPWLPAPLHLAPALWGLKYLTIRERISIARGLLRLARTTPAREMSIGQWLRERGQSERVIELFWTPVLVSALSETLDRASLTAARQVFVRGFMAHQQAYELIVPTVSLGELYGERIHAWLAERGVKVHLSTPVATVVGDAARVSGIELVDGEQLPFDAVVVAVPWRRAAELFPPAMHAALPHWRRWAEIEPAPITAVHLWFDKPLAPLAHAVLVGRLSQWLFYRGQVTWEGQAAHHYQVVISASRSLAGRDRDEVFADVIEELLTIFPAMPTTRLFGFRCVTEQAAVFSVAPGLDEIRPPQRTAIGNLALAGDWTATGWPGTMEGAVRSGYLAAEVLLQTLGKPCRVLVDDLPMSRLMRWLV